eukprot:COSAG02_NODE_63935_length_262_cov_0.539877_1_plen_60_part_01
MRLHGGVDVAVRVVGHPVVVKDRLAELQSDAPDHVEPFFKQKTAYEISECDWSSDVCSSD